MEKFSLTAGLLVAGIAALAFTTDLTKHNLEKEPRSGFAKNEVAAKIEWTDKWVSSSEKDTVPAQDEDISFRKEFSNINTVVDGKEYRIVLKNGKITELSIDEKRIPDDKINDYKDVTSKILKEAKENWERDIKQAEIARRESQQARKQSERDRERAMTEERIEAFSKQQQSEALAREFEMATKGSKEERIKAENYWERKEKNSQDKPAELIEKIRKIETDYREQQLEEREVREKIELLRERTAEQDRELSIVRQKLVTVETEKAMKEAIQLQKEADAARVAAKELQVKAEISALIAKQSQADAEKILKSIVQDLMDAHVIDDTKKLTFLLTGEELIVNGVKQPDAIHKKLKEKYIREKGGSYNYNYGNKEQ